jgi:hypothetical protein
VKNSSETIFRSLTTKAKHYSTAWNIQTPLMSTGSCLMKHTRSKWTLLATIDESLDALGNWDNADTHYRFHSHEKVNLVGIQPRSEQSDFWKKHFAGFVKNSIPSIIDTSHLHQPPKGIQNNRVHPSYSDIACGNGHPDNDSDVTSPTAAETATQQTRQRPQQVPGPKLARLSRTALPTSPTKAPCPV